MNEMEKFEKELNKLEVDSLEDEEFKKRLRLKLIESYDRKKFTFHPLLKISLAVGLILLIFIPLYIVFSPRARKGLPEEGMELSVSQKNSSDLIRKLTEKDKLLSIEEKEDKKILVYKSGLKIIESKGSLVEISYGEEKELSFEAETKQAVNEKDLRIVREVIRKDPKIGFLIDEGKMEKVSEIEKPLYRVILKSMDREWEIIVDTEKEKVLNFSSPPK